MLTKIFMESTYCDEETYFEQFEQNSNEKYAYLWMREDLQESWRFTLS
jgi:hypothetical protein